jgi:hypothetical protein
VAYNGSIGPARYCHCEDCRRANGSAFDVSVRLEKKNLVVTASSELRSYKYPGGGGREIERCFCGRCGSPIYTFHTAKPEFVWIKAGVMNNPELVKPAFENWASDKVPWAAITLFDTDHFRRPPPMILPETCENAVSVR